MRILLAIAALNLLRAKRRTVFLGSAVGCVAAVFVLLSSLYAGLVDNLTRTGTALLSGHVNVAGVYKETSGRAEQLMSQNARVRSIVAKVPGVGGVVDRQLAWGRVISETSSLQAKLQGIDLDEEGRLRELLEPAAGALDLSSPRSVILFQRQATRLGVEPGESLSLSVTTPSGAVNSVDVRVAGVARDIGVTSNWNVLVSKETLRELLGRGLDTTSVVMAYAEDPRTAESVMLRVRDALGKAGFDLMGYEPEPAGRVIYGAASEEWVGERLNLSTWRDEVSSVEWVLTALRGISMLLLTVLVIIVAAGIASSMWIAVHERTAEIGTMRAIGMSRGLVLLLVLTEAFFLGLAASLVGTLVGVALSLAIDAADIRIPVTALEDLFFSSTFRLRVNTGQIFWGAGALTVWVSLCTLWPAIRAARMQPVTAIQRLD